MSPATTTLLTRLSTTNHPLSAQHDYLTSGTRYRDAFAALTGQAPAIYGSDFSFLYAGSDPASIGHCGPANLLEPGHAVARWTHDPARVFTPECAPAPNPIPLETQRTALIDRCLRLHTEENAIITLMWHCPPPGCGDSAHDGDLWIKKPYPDSAWDDLFNPDSARHRDWCVQVDRIAAHLRRLADADVPVLWRPYHEMNGGWFWWGRRPGPSGYARLWRLLYDRLVRIHKLDNLIWVWNPNAPRDTPGDEAGPYADYYPGGDVVDVLATDVYHNDYRDSHHDDLLELADGRPIALGEVGHLPTPEVLARQPRWAWVMPWGGLLLRFNSDESIQTLYAQVARLHRDR